ncbi:MAG: YbjN domain-containing protein [Planctomycetes bacterium]|nr:YbjN domain-containing protein [Planctomycetota bacterium]
MHVRLALVAGTAAFVLAFNSGPAHAQPDKILKQLTTDQIESILKDFNIDYKKIEAKPDQPNNYYYDFERNRYKVRLHFFGGKDIMLDALFKDYPLDKLNGWNKRAKFSRATLHKDDKGPFTALESNLDFIGGVTQGTIEQFFKTFDDELKGFDRYVTGGSAQPPAKDEKIVTQVSDEMLEKILDGLNLKYKKNTGKGVTNYDFQSQNHMLRLTNFGTKDLMIDAAFKVIPLDKLNKYNTDNKFIRAVHYKTDNSQHVALESNLDCVGGVTESIIQYFIKAFSDDVKKFSKYVQDNQE